MLKFLLFNTHLNFMPSFNIALIPKNQEQFINYANSLPYANKNTSTYLVSKQSIPHITLCHFEADAHAIEGIWKEISQQDFTQVSKIKLGILRNSIYPNDNGPNARCWTSLIPDKLCELKTLHFKMAKIIKYPKNAAFDQYDPHMTLFNNNLQSCPEIESSKVLSPPFEEIFDLALGTLDKVGQMPKILYNIHSVAKLST